MNKDVIYIEPEDDITDIITKIEKAKNKIVALIPPKKAGVFRSIVNIKLIAKAGASSEKTVVIVTADPSIVKLAAAARIPVAESLQSAPSIPKNGTTKEAANSEEAESSNGAVASDDSETETETNEEVAKDKNDTIEISADEVEETEEESDEEAKEVEEAAVAEVASKIKEEAKTGDDSKKKKKADDGESGGWFRNHKKLLIFSGVFGVVLVAVLVWAFGFAPAVDISVAMKTDQKNFSENILLVNDIKEENVKEGKFYAEEKKLEDVKEVAFEATGKKNVGEKAKGDLVAYAYFKESGAIPVAAGSLFKISEFTYASDEAATIKWDGKDTKECENSSSATIVTSGCLVSTRIKVTATEGGEKYNIGASNSGWNAVLSSQVAVYSDKAMTGGTDEYVTIVQQSDIEKAKESLSSSSETVNKAKLMATIGDDKLVLEDSFKYDASKAVATPGADEQVNEGVKPVLKATATSTIYVLDKVKLEEFIEAKVKLEDNQKIFEIQGVRLESLIDTDDGQTAKLKAQYFVGPKITESELVSKVLGKGIGDAKREISDACGPSSEVKIETSYPWVMAVPGDSNKVTIKFEIKDQNTNKN